MRLLVHMCCGPCSVYPVKKALEGRMEVWGYFYNPNIHPYTEYKKRLDAVKILAYTMELKVIYNDSYDMEEFLRNTIGDIEGRCTYCYTTRLDSTARAAKEHEFDLFSTSILYSRYQKHDLTRRIGEEVAEKHGIPFYYEDFRPGWREGITESKEMGLYRQQYCGCIYSEKERYLGARSG